MQGGDDEKSRRSTSSSVGEKRKSSEEPGAKDESSKKKMSFGMIGKAPGYKPKVGFQNKKAPLNPIKMSLGTQKKQEPVPLKKPSQTAASVFNEESDSEEEEMPLEARMRMKNVGKFTPTAAGPNSFGKGNMGFVDRRALLKKELDEQWKKTKEEDEEFKRKHNIQITPS